MVVQPVVKIPGQSANHRLVTGVGIAQSVGRESAQVKIRRNHHHQFSHFCSLHSGSDGRRCSTINDNVCRDFSVQRQDLSVFQQLRLELVVTKVLHIHLAIQSHHRCCSCRLSQYHVHRFHADGTVGYMRGRQTYRHQQI